MMITDVAARTAKAIVNIFETSQVLGDYSQVTLISGDTGQLTYGRSQTTLTSGGLHGLIHAYCDERSSHFAEALSPYLTRLENKDSKLNQDVYFHNLLRASADDPIMRNVQDEFFDKEYWQRVLKIAESCGIETALGTTVVYDSHVHGSWAFVSDLNNSAVGSLARTGEEIWITEYVNQRLKWLANHEREDLRKTTYRMNAFLTLIDRADWSLELPIVVRGIEISNDSLNALPPRVYNGPAVRSRSLALTVPVVRGLDVRLAQLALSNPANNFQIVADGTFGRFTRDAVLAFQNRASLTANGIVDDAVFGALGLS